MYVMLQVLVNKNNDTNNITEELAYWDCYLFDNIIFILLKQVKVVTRLSKITNSIFNLQSRLQI